MISPYYYPSVRTNDGHNGKIKVTGAGSVTVKANEIIIQLGVMTRNKSAQVAQQENAAITTQLIAGLNKIGIENSQIQTSSYTVLPYYRTFENQQNLEGFEINHQLEVTLKDMGAIGAVLDTAFQSGANTTQNLIFKVSDQSKYYKEALSMAVKDAIQKAKVIARTLGIPINPTPIKITELSGVIPFRKQEALFAAASTPIMVRDIEIEAKVEGEFLMISG